MKNNNNIEQVLTTSFTKTGQPELARIWDCAPSEAGRRMSGQRNISLEDFGIALQAMNIRLVADQDAVIISQDKYLALQTLAKEALERDNEKSDH